MKNFRAISLRGWRVRSQPSGVDFVEKDVRARSRVGGEKEDASRGKRKWRRRGDSNPCKSHSVNNRSIRQIEQRRQNRRKSKQGGVVGARLTKKQELDTVGQK